MEKAPLTLTFLIASLLVIAMGQSQSKRTASGSSRAGSQEEGRHDNSLTEAVRRGLKRVRSFFARSSQQSGSETSSVAPLQSSKRIRTEEGVIEVTMAGGGVQQEGRYPTVIVERDAPWNRFKRSLSGQIASLSVSDDVIDIERGDPGDAKDEEEYLQFPFLTDERSRKWVSDNPVLFVMRGLSGSGKSTVVRAIVRAFPGATVCSADSFFEDTATGEYRWRADGLRAAHEECQKSAEDALENSGGVVIVDNTNVREVFNILLSLISISSMQFAATVEHLEDAPFHCISIFNFGLKWVTDGGVTVLLI